MADLEKEIVRLKKEGSSSSSSSGGGASARELRDLQEQLDTASSKLRAKEVQKKRDAALVGDSALCLQQDELKRVRADLNEAADKEMSLRDELRKLRAQSGGSGSQQELDEAKVRKKKKW